MVGQQEGAGSNPSFLLQSQHKISFFFRSNSLLGVDGTLPPFDLLGPANQIWMDDPKYTKTFRTDFNLTFPKYLQVYTWRRPRFFRSNLGIFVYLKRK